jgi:hypothetical protein
LTGGCPTGKAHFTETCEPDRPHLIVHVATTAATTADVETMPARHADLASLKLLPDEHLVDASYVSVDGVLAARADHGVELVGPLTTRLRLQGPRRGRLRPEPVRHRLGPQAGHLPQTARPPATGAQAPAATGCRLCR